MIKVRTRIAPSPTGNPHIGTIYQALFNYAYAKKHNGVFMMRIEDTDQARKMEGAEEKLFASLDWFKLIENESIRKGGEYGPYKQSERLPLYRKYAEQLVREGKAYYCDCSPQRLDEVRKKLQAEKKTPMYDRHCRELNKTNGVIRLKIQDDKTYTWQDGIRGEMAFRTSQHGSPLIDDQVLMKSDGFPTYHLAVVVDDHMMQITHAVRGEEWISSTSKHIILYHHLGWEKEIPLFIHTPLLRNPDKSKLSKRHGHTDVTWYREEGFLPEAILNFLALLGWSHPEEKEIFSLDEFITLFDFSDLHAVGPIFDLTKLTWMNGEYIRAMDVEKLVSRLETYYAERPQENVIPDSDQGSMDSRLCGNDKREEAQKINLDTIDESTLKQIVGLAQSRIETLKEFYPLISHFLPNATFTVRDEKEKAVAQSLVNALAVIQDWNSDTILETLRGVLKEHGIRMPILYTIVTGKERGLPLPESLAILGKDTVLARLKQALV